MTVERYLMEALKSSPVYIEDVFSTYLYTGNGSTQTITNNIDLSTKGGMVWCKSRGIAYKHILSNTTDNFYSALVSNSTSAAENGVGYLSSPSTTGFTLGATAAINSSGDPCVSWTFRKQPKFFDVVTYTGDGTTTSSVAHNLGSVPGLVIVKATSTTSDWNVIARYGGGVTYIGGQSTPVNNLFTLNSTNIAQTSANAANRDLTSTSFNPGKIIGNTSSGFTAAGTNTNGVSYIAYLFANQAGGFGLTGSDSVIACDTQTTNASGVLSVNLGWEPQFVLYRNTTTAGSSWQIVDVMRGMSYTDNARLFPNSTSVELTGTVVVVPNATGFTLTQTANADYFYMAIRRGPMKVPTSGTSVFSPVVQSGTVAAGGLAYNFGFPPDAVIEGVQGGAGFSPTSTSRLTGNYQFMITASTAAESSDGGYRQYTTSMFGMTYGISLNFGDFGGIVGWGFRRAPGYMDEVCYTGTGVARTVAHNLGVAPELMIVKCRSEVQSWAVYNATLGATKLLFLASNAPATTSSIYWNDTTPTSNVFTVGVGFITNKTSATYVAYLFATCPGVSKIGSYTGTGAAQNIDCGFAAGARFVLIKRTDSTGDWYVYDSARGISSGSDPYLLLNSTAAQVTGTNYVDTFASGFTLTASAPAGLNANGGSYIFLAVA